MMRRARKGSVGLDQPELPLFSAGTPTPGTVPPTTPEVAFSPLDQRFAELLLRLHGGPHELLAQAGRLVSAARTAGESCLPLARLGSPDATRAELLATGLVGAPGAFQPLILDAGDRLYLHRYWRYEQQLAGAVAGRLHAAPPVVDATAVETALSAWLAGDKAAGQRHAAQVAVTSRFCIITGGPGTGKTRTVAVILALLDQLAAAAGQPAPVVALAAPTGKAAMRLQESVRQVLGTLDPPAPSRAVEAVTLHRLLGLTGDSPRPRADARHPLPAQVVIVDEASMIDLPMMAKLFAAVAPEARLILLGDRDQLPPVETGHVLADLCAEPAPSALAAKIAPLRRNFRFSEGSGIRLLSEAVQRGEAETVLSMLAAGELPDLHARETPGPETLREAVQQVAVAGYAATCAAHADPAAALAALGEFRILCALREGPYGVKNLNTLVESALGAAGHLVPGARHYAGRPVMILRNDYTLGLYNGDIGLLLPDPDAGGELRAFFSGEDGALRHFSPARLPEHETAWAMTVHKSQGSEFRRVLLVLPERESPIVSRELIYTAITRARAAAELWYRPGALRTALASGHARASGLPDALRTQLGD